MPAMHEASTRRRAIAELAMVAATGVGHWIMNDVLHKNGPYVVAAVVFWVAYVAWRVRREPGLARAWGVRTDNLRPSLAANVALVVVGGAAMLAYGLWRGRSPTGSFYAMLALYPIFGFVQQLVICPLVYGNLRALTGRPRAAIAIACALFVLVHVPQWTLAAFTGVAVAIWMMLYERWPNLYAQGLSHGMLAAFLYTFVLAQDPFMDVMRSLGL